MNFVISDVYANGFPPLRVFVTCMCVQMQLPLPCGELRGVHRPRGAHAAALLGRALGAAAGRLAGPRVPSRAQRRQRYLIQLDTSHNYIHHTTTNTTQLLTPHNSYTT